MTVLQGAFWISDQEHRKYLNAGADGIVWGTAPGPRGLDLLNSTAPRTRSWLIEKATDGKNFRFRNYETGTALGIKDQSSDEGAQIIVTDGTRESQVWEVNWLEKSALGGIYQIKNALTSAVLDQASSNSVVSSCPHGGRNQAWLIEPVLLPTLYWVTNSAAASLVLRASDRLNATDSTIRGVALVSKDLSARNQLWSFEYTSLSECILRSAAHDQFVLDLSAQDSQTLFARKHHGGPNQRWVVKDEDENKRMVSLANVNTNTLLATRKQQLLGGCTLDRLVVAIEGNTSWQIDPSPRPPFFWATIQSLHQGAFLVQADDGSIVLSRGALHANDHTVQWRFIILGKDPQYVIVNRATGLMLKHRASNAYGAPVVAESDDRNDVGHHWTLNVLGGTRVSIADVGSKCALVHYSTIQTYPLGAIDKTYYQWIITPFYDTLPSFALVNSQTGRCIANRPNPNVGTIITTDNINDFQSQWVFYQIESSLCHALLNKMSGNVLEHYKGTRIEAHDSNHSDNYQKWRLLPLRERYFGLLNGANSRYLYDSDDTGPSTDGSPPEDTRVLHWQLVSHRESGFDFISLDFDILQRMISYNPSNPNELQQFVMSRVATNKIKKGTDKSAYIPSVTRITQISNDTIRVVLARLIGRWDVDSFPETSQPYTITSTDRREVEQQWGVPLSERSLRRRSEEAGWIRIDLQGVYDVNGSWLANIQGQWLEDPVFQIIIPAGIHVGRTIIRRAMLQSLTEGLAVEIRTTPPAHTSAANKGGRPGIFYLPSSLGTVDDEKMNSLALILGSIEISNLKHNGL